jgi:hypothetical protein
MANQIPMIDVPEIEEDAYDHDRPISGLVHNQLIHLSAAEHSLPKAKWTGINIARLHTEREAAAYIQKITKLLHPQGGAKKKTARSKTPTGKARSRKIKTAGTSSRGRKTARVRR